MHEAVCQPPAQHFGVQTVADVPCDERQAILALARADIHAAHFGLRCNDAFDFARLNSVAADLDLEVTTAEELDLAIRQEASEVPGTVQAASAERIGTELLLGQIGPAQIAACHRRPADTDFANAAKRDRLPPIIQQMDLIAG